ncbi:pyridoxal-phosphate dependent enzyme [Streptomyces afghaniensis]|uniref:pyridoxal-phosphate dependent enzyme n=1 Tax=Streptomyces afghaniensis TaxID=66865 RepID=UPI0033A8B674
MLYENASDVILDDIFLDLTGFIPGVELALKMEGLNPAGFPTVDHLFVGAGTTGTLMGVARYFRQYSPRTRIVAVDTAGSITFGFPPGPRRIPGLGTSRRPEIFRPGQADETVLVPEADAIRMCRRLAAERGLLLGGSTGALEGVRVLYVGEGNNTATALAQGLSHVPGCRVTFATPPGYELPADILEEAAKRGAEHGTELVQSHSMDELPDQVDFVYTTRWQTTGTSKGDAHWRQTFRPFHVDEALMNRWPDAWFLHDLPAHRGDEVAAGVLDGERSVAWIQARMKLTSAMAALEWAAGTA